MKLKLVIGPHKPGKNQVSGMNLRVVNAENGEEVPTSDVIASFPLESFVTAEIHVVVAEIEQVSKEEWIKRFGHPPHVL